MRPPHDLSTLTTTLQRVRVPSFVSGRDGTISWQNDAARQLFGDAAGRSYATFVAPESVPVVAQQIARKLAGAPVTDYEIDVVTKDGMRRRVEISSVPSRAAMRVTRHSACCSARSGLRSANARRV